MNELTYNDGVSVATCSMNRSESLMESIETWNSINEIKEIIVLDWSSSVPIRYSDLPEAKSGKDIKLVRVENQEHWVLTHAFNLAISFARFDKLLKLDSDVLLDESFLSSHKLKPSSFYRGNWQIARNENELHLNGQLYCRTQDFWKVNGYHEGIVTYGWDDSDIYSRLSESGLKPLDFNYDLFNHIESTHKARHVNQDIGDLSDLFKPDITKLSGNSKIEALHIAQELKFLSPPESGESIRLWYQTQRNRIWCKLNPWLQTSIRRKWDIIKESSNSYICTDVK
jgi:hypothetical protein